MSGEDIPYQLRPNKFIDRQIFVDLLCQIVPLVGADQYVYISMGGKHLVDHAAVYRQVGIRQLFSFDSNEKIVARQIANKPIDSAVCQTLSSGNLAGALDGIMASFDKSKNVVIWLDYTSPNERLTQFQELVEVGKRAQAGDIIRITLNANTGSLDGPKGSDAWKKEGYQSPQLYRLEKLKEQLGSLVPTDLTTIGDDDFPTVLARCTGLSFSKIEAEREDISFLPVLNTSYRDGQRMVTMTGLALSRDDVAGVTSRLAAWRLLPKDWSDVVRIAAPDLSVREKMKIDEHLSMDSANIAERIGFLVGASDERSLEAIASYKKLHRYYPSFHHVDS